MESKDKPKRASNRRIWLTGLVVALAAHATGLFLFNVVEDDLHTPEPERFTLSLPSILWQEAQGDLLREQAHLFDSAPLFLPTRWNSASSPVVRGLEQSPGDLFNPFPARLSYGEADFGLGTSGGERAKPPLESLKIFGDQTHTVFGRGEVDQPALDPRFAVIEVFDFAHGQIVFRDSVSSSEAPVIPSRLWRPVDFLLQVEPIGVVGEPVLLGGSGVEEVDQFLRGAVRGMVQKRMPAPGFYRVSVGH
jgi:hypothetical protein